jgi:hypothetical protein
MVLVLFVLQLCWVAVSKAWPATTLLLFLGVFRCLFVDEVNELLLAAMSDKSTYVYKVDDAMPLAR